MQPQQSLQQMLSATTRQIDSIDFGGGGGGNIISQPQPQFRPTVGRMPHRVASSVAMTDTVVGAHNYPGNQLRPLPTVPEHDSSAVLATARARRRTLIIGVCVFLGILIIVIVGAVVYMQISKRKKRQEEERAAEIAEQNAKQAAEYAAARRAAAIESAPAPAPTTQPVSTQPPSIASRVATALAKPPASAAPVASPAPCAGDTCDRVQPVVVVSPEQQKQQLTTEFVQLQRELAARVAREAIAAQTAYTTAPQVYDEVVLTNQGAPALDVSSPRQPVAASEEVLNTVVAARPTADAPVAAAS